MFEGEQNKDTPHYRLALVAKGVVDYTRRQAAPPNCPVPYQINYMADAADFASAFEMPLDWEFIMDHLTNYGRSREYWQAKLRDIEHRMRG